MTLEFTKYQGAGNDFIIVDDRSLAFPSDNQDLIRHLCHRQKGIGADGVILLQTSPCSDAAMRIFNADGSEAEMCGNGLRCLVHFLNSLGVQNSVYRILTKHSTFTCKLHGERVSMVIEPPKVMHWGLELDVSIGKVQLDVLDTGVPHAVLFVSDLESVDVMQLGREIRTHAAFSPRGVNANFICLSKENEVLIRTYERGVEGETLACGTGSAAAAFVAQKRLSLSYPLRVIPRSNDVLEFCFTDRLEMFGPATPVFRGLC